MTGPAPLGAREALARALPIDPDDGTVIIRYEWHGAIAVPEWGTPEDCAGTLLAALRAARYAVIYVEEPAESDSSTPDDMPQLQRRMLNSLLDSMGPEAMGEVLAERGYQVVKVEERGFERGFEQPDGRVMVPWGSVVDVTDATHERQVWRGPWVPVSGEEQQP